MRPLSDPNTARQSLPCALPRAPVLDWASFRVGDHRIGAATAPSVQDLPSVAYTTSGRAAIYQALLQLALPTGSRVLVPTYHCPTMVAPVLRAGLEPAYYGLRPDGLPDLAALECRGGAGAAAIIVAHYFGLPRSLANVRSWCDTHGIALIEDCAHCYFGLAGEKPVGHWGDYATASLSKFFPVPEAGLLGSAHRAIAPLALRPPGARAQVKGCVDVLEFSARHRRLAGLSRLLSPVFALKNRLPKATAPTPPTDMAAAEGMTGDCDMSRVADAPLWVSMVLNSRLPRQPILTRRCENFAHYREAFDSVRGARPLFDCSPPAAAPYVFPLWVDDADRIYQAMRAIELPVFRWDKIWPGTPALAGDTGALWSRHVLQLLCHQDLRPDDIARTVQATLRLLRPTSDEPVVAVSAGAPGAKMSAGLPA